MDIVDFPKLECPFVRHKRGDGRYLVSDEIAEGFEWIYDNGVRAVDKLHGTNVCVNIEDGHIHSIDNRKTRVIEGGYRFPVKMAGMVPRIFEGVVNTLEKEHYLKYMPNGKVYGELIGPRINGNLHCVAKHIFVPFGYLNEFCHWKSFVSNRYPKSFSSFSDWFRELPSLFTQKAAKKEALAEGLIFLHPNGRRCKLRRDMFDWYEGEQFTD